MSLIALTLVWFALWGDASWGNLIGGVAAATVAIWMLPSRQSAGGLGFGPVAAMRLAGFFLWRLVVATAIVAWEIVTPSDRTRPAIVAVRLDAVHPTIITVVANMVSLTPGTITIDIETDPTILYIHVLHYESAARTNADIARLERYLVAAMPPLEAKEAGVSHG